MSEGWIALTCIIIICLIILGIRYYNINKMKVSVISEENDPVNRQESSDQI